MYSRILSRTIPDGGQEVGTVGVKAVDLLVEWSATSGNIIGWLNRNHTVASIGSSQLVSNRHWSKEDGPSSNFVYMNSDLPAYKLIRKRSSFWSKPVIIHQLLDHPYPRYVAYTHTTVSIEAFFLTQSPKLERLLTSLVGKMLYSTFLLLCLLCCNCIALQTLSLPNTPFPFPVGPGYVFHKPAWVENIAVRSNGPQLLTRLDTPELHIIDMAAAAQDIHPELVYRFPHALGLTGIAEIAPDVFAVIAGNYTLASGPTIGSWAIWRVNMSSWGTSSPEKTLTLGNSQVTKIADIPEAAYLKGMTQLSEQHVLLSDFRAGVVYRLDVNTGAYTVVIENSMTEAVPQPIFGLSGISGLRVQDGHLYFTNTGQNIFAKMPIHADGTPAGTASIIAHTGASTDYFDGFTFGAHGDVYIGTGSGNAVVKFPQAGGPVVRVAGRLDSTIIAQPTNCAFGRGREDQGVLYVVSAGGVAAPVQGKYVTGGKILVVQAETERSES